MRKNNFHSEENQFQWEENQIKWEKKHFIVLPEEMDENHFHTEVHNMQNDWIGDEAFREKGNIKFPCDLAALNMRPLTDIPFGFRKQIKVPEGFAGKKLFLQMTSIHQRTEVWIDGAKAGENTVPYIPGFIELTDYLYPGKVQEMYLRCLQPADHLCGWPGETKTPTDGGFLHHMNLLAFSDEPLMELMYETVMQENGEDFLLKIHLTRKEDLTDEESIRFTLLDDRKEIVLQEEWLWEAASSVLDARVPVTNPRKWDMEHPFLYEAVLEEKDRLLSYRHNIGFRQITKVGQEILLNGKKIKLRGVARYSLDPLTGKEFTKEQIWEELKRIRAANVNFIRLSVYPEQEAYFTGCDELGILLQVCTPVTFQQEKYDTLGFPVVRHTCDKPKYREQYLHQFSAMIHTYRNHPSVGFWEFANESDWGENLMAEIEYARKTDSSRLTTGTWGREEADIFAYHYPKYDEIHENCCIYDEYIHIPTHALGTLKRDPGIRNAWGDSIEKGWNALYPAKGVAGVSVFALGDFIMMSEDGKIANASFGQWGILDKWLREKPEYWLLKRAYSPVYLDMDSRCRKGDDRELFPGNVQEAVMEIPMENRYAFRSLREIKAYLAMFKGDEWQIWEEELPDLQPGECGVWEIPLDEDIKEFYIWFREPDGTIVDIRHIRPENDRLPVREQISDGPAVLSEKEKEYLVEGEGFRLTIRKDTGLITVWDEKEHILLAEGPYLNMKGLYYKATEWPRFQDGDFALDISTWKMTDLCVKQEKEYVWVTLCGVYDGKEYVNEDGRQYGFAPVEVLFTLMIKGDGSIQAGYEIKNAPEYLACELGVLFFVPDRLMRLSWKREAPLDYYPANHIGRAEGTAYLHYRGEEEYYRRKPDWDWSLDERDFVLYGKDAKSRGTNDFRSTKENIYYACLSDEEENGIWAEGSGRDSVRCALGEEEGSGFTGQLAFYVNQHLFYDLGGGSLPEREGDMAWGNKTVPERLFAEITRGEARIYLGKCIAGDLTAPCIVP